MTTRTLPIVQVDAFASERFTGNPAAVVILPEWLPDSTLQAIAAENNLAETAFVVPRSEVFDLRWFTPEIEVDLCGHATLASAHVLFADGYAREAEVVFRYREGTLAVTRDEDLLVMDFPARPPVLVAEGGSASSARGRRSHVAGANEEAAGSSPVGVASNGLEAVSKALGARPAGLYASRDLLAVFESQAEVEALEPDFAAIAALDTFGVITSAPGDDCDFVSRFFAPGAGVPEDAVTGSAHCTLVPYWSERLGRSPLYARQVSRRGGDLFCEDRGERVGIGGRAVEYLRGEIFV